VEFGRRVGVPLRMAGMMEPYSSRARQVRRRRLVLHDRKVLEDACGTPCERLNFRENECRRPVIVRRRASSRAALKDVANWMGTSLNSIADN